MEHKCRPTKNSHSSLGQWTSPKGVQPSELVVLMHSSIDQVKALASSPQVSTRFDGRCTIVWLKVLTLQDCGSGKVCDKKGRQHRVCPWTTGARSGGLLCPPESTRASARGRFENGGDSSEAGGWETRLTAARKDSWVRPRSV